MADLARGVMEEAILNEHTPTNTTTNGIGVYRWDDNGQYYAGDWKDGKQNGNGVMRFPNGGVYEGEHSLILPRSNPPPSSHHFPSSLPLNTSHPSLSLHLLLNYASTTLPRPLVLSSI